MLDSFHASGHLHAAAVARHGAGATAEAWYAARRRTLLESGAAGVLEALEGESGDASELVGYLRPHADHTPYRQRLAEGRSIGSGLVEGACKTAIGRRLKQTGARWQVRRLGRMAALCCLVYSEHFDAYWKHKAGLRSGSATTPDRSTVAISPSYILDTGMRNGSIACSGEPDEVPDDEVNAHLGNTG